MGSVTLNLESFKPCYKWNTFNTIKDPQREKFYLRRFKPCYKWNTFNTGLQLFLGASQVGFKPCYKWNTFNTIFKMNDETPFSLVLNLVISGIPSILKRMKLSEMIDNSVLNLVISGIPSIPMNRVNASFDNVGF